MENLMARAPKSGIPRVEVDQLMKGGSWSLESLVVSGFTTMPKGVRIAVYVVLALVLLYTQLILPTLITGRLVNEEARDKILLGKISYWISDHKSSSEVNPNSGAWSIPMFWRLPRDIKVDVQIANSDTKTIAIPFTTVIVGRKSWKLRLAPAQKPVGLAAVWRSTRTAYNR